MKNNLVSYVRRDIDDYPGREYAFSPSIRYPEYKYDVIAKEKNDVYDMVRESFFVLGMDSENQGTPDWNPLGDIINPDDTVVIKPNWIIHINPEKTQHDTKCLVTNPSVVRAVADYVLIALREGSGRLIIGDSPTWQCDLDSLVNNMGYDAVFDFYKEREGEKVSKKDFRDLIISSGDEYGKKVTGSHGVIVDLQRDSALNDFSEKEMDDFRIYGYSSEIMKEAHAKDKHQYMIHEDILNADVIINIPKPKTHRKAGMTACCKNFVGINCRKEYLPHHRVGSADEGGDEYNHKNIIKSIHSSIAEKFFSTKNPGQLLSFANKMTRGAELVLSRDKKYDGGWYGNETLWRMVADLNQIVEFADPDGVIKTESQRKIFNVCDMIIPGQGEGPLKPIPKQFGAIVCGENRVMVDYLIAELMGFDQSKIKYIFYLMESLKINPKDYYVTDKENHTERITDFKGNRKDVFIPAQGWAGHIEKRL